MPLEDKIAAIRVRETETIARIESVLKTDTRYIAAKKRHDDVVGIRDAIKTKHKLRECNMFAKRLYGLPYLCMLVALGYVEWLVNFSTFDKLFGIPLLVTGCISGKAGNTR